MVTNPSDPLAHDLHRWFPRLGEYHSTKALEGSDLYQSLKPQILRVLNGYQLESFSAASPQPDRFFRAVAWNIERGIHFEGILRILEEHPVLKTADLYLLTETDLGMARSANRNVARELALALGLNYLFAPSYLNLAKGCGVEHDSEGENTLAIHGNAVLSRYPIREPKVVALPNALDKMRGREKRIGQQRALLATVDLGGRPLRVACVHLDMRSRQRHRKIQMEYVLQALEGESNRPILLGGDWNTSTYDSHSASSAIIGFWIRVLMGVGTVMDNHYLKPDRFFERRLFKMLEEKGLDYKGCNEEARGTVHYSVEDIKAYRNLREWLPDWCFKFIAWSLKDHGGLCSFKVDWFAQRGLKVLSDGEAESLRKGSNCSPRVVGRLAVAGQPVSDHDALVLDFAL